MQTIIITISTKCLQQHKTEKIKLSSQRNCRNIYTHDDKDISYTIKLDVF